MNFILSSGTIPQWMQDTFPIFERIILVLVALLALVLVVLVFMQITDGNGTSNAITGNQDSYYSQNKSGSREGRITRTIYIVIGIILVLSVAYFLLIKACPLQ